MLRERYAPYSLFDAVPRLALRFDPELAEVDRLLDDEPLFRLVRDDLARRYPRTTETGRLSTPVEVVLRLLAVKRLYGWSYADAVRFVADSLVLRQFCRLGLEPVPDRSTLIRWANLIRPATLHALLERVVELARAARVTRGRRLRTDGTVVETDVHPPSDSTLLADAPDTAAGQRLRAGLARIAPLLDRVVEQTVARALRGGAVPAAQKVCSLFEPHTAVIQRGKVRTPTEFGRKLWLDEVDGGIVTRYALLAGNPPDADQLPASLEHHRARFGRPPDLLAGDRGTHSPANEALAAAAGVRRVSLPKPGHRAAARVAHERQRWFRRAQRWRGGVEGRISLLRRRFGLRRCRDRGEDAMERWVGWGVVVHDLRVIARATARRAA